MQKIRSAVKTPLALLVFLAVMAHLAPIVLLASSFKVLTSRDDFLALLGGPSLTYNFNDLVDGHYNRINVGGLSIAGDMFVERGAVNFSGASGAALNFAGGIFAWGADVMSIGGAGRLNLSFGGENAIYDINQPGFVGFIADFGFSAINASFGALDPIILTFNSASATNFVIDNVVVNAVPEPTTLLLLATGAGLLGVSNRRRKRTEERGQDQGDGGQAI